MQVFTCFFLSLYSCLLLNFSGLLQSWLETLILGKLPLFTKLSCGLVIIAFPCVCTPSKKDHAVLWAPSFLCFHKKTFSFLCQDKGKHRSMNTLQEIFHTSKELWWSVNSTEPCRRQKWGPSSAEPLQPSHCWVWMCSVLVSSFSLPALF